MLRFLFLAALGLLMLGSAALGEAGETREPLRGITAVRLKPLGVDREAERCGITESLVREAIMFPASMSKLRITDQGGFLSPVLLITVSVLHLDRDDQCFSSVRLELLNNQQIKLDFSNEPPVWVDVLLWRNTWIFASSASRHPLQLRTAIESQTKKFLADWSLANKN
jgi:hypothetical protein